MAKSSGYVSKLADESGVIHWEEEENKIWSELYTRQKKLLQGRACKEFMHGLELLNLSENEIPQLHSVDAVLQETTGWRTAQVPALINFGEFFRLLANKQFPVATFIRSREEFDYLQEPDIFHEIFGHCPMLTNPAFAHFTHSYGKLGLDASKEERVFLARLYWFTVEFGLLQTEEGLRIYGGGILSSPGETIAALEAEGVERFPLQVLDTLRTPYRIDIMQPIYYILDDLKTLDDLAEMDLLELVAKAKEAGLFEPKFPPKIKVAS